MYNGLHPFLDLLSDALSSVRLTEMELDVFRRLYGLDSDLPEDMSKVAADYYLPVDQVRLIEAQGLHKVRDAAASRRWSGQGHPCSVLMQYLRADFLSAGAVTKDYLAHLVTNVSDEWLPTPVLRRVIAHLLNPAEFYGHWSPELASRRYPTVPEWSKELLESAQAVLDRYIIWPQKVKLYPSDFRLAKQRNVSKRNGRVNGYWSRKLGQFIECESNQEARFYYFGLECSDRVRWYQEQPLEIPYDAGGGRMARYYPDVAFGLDDGRVVIVEVKSFRHMPLDENLRKWGALRRYCAEHGYGLLVTNGIVGIQYYTRRSVSASIDRKVVNIIKRKGVLTRADFRAACGHRRAMRELLTIILKRRLVWTLKPFEVRAGASSRL